MDERGGEGAGQFFSTSFGCSFWHFAASFLPLDAAFALKSFHILHFLYLHFSPDFLERAAFFSHFFFFYFFLFSIFAIFIWLSISISPSCFYIIFFIVVIRCSFDIIHWTRRTEIVSAISFWNKFHIAHISSIYRYVCESGHSTRSADSDIKWDCPRLTCY